MTCRTLPVDWPVLSNIPPELRNDVTGFHVFGPGGQDLVFTVAERVVVDPKTSEETRMPASVHFKPSDVDEVLEIPQLRGKSVVNVVASKVVTVFVLTTDMLYGWGQNTNGQVGVGSKDEWGFEKMAEINLNKEVPIHVATSKEHSAAVTKSGSLYTWGASHLSESERAERLGHNGSGLEPVKVEVKAKGDHNFVQVACTSESIYALNSEGKIYSLDREVFLTIQGDAITEISAGYHHVLALSFHGSIFCWGKNHKKQLGFCSDVEDQLIDQPKQVASLKTERISSAFAFRNMSLALSYNGTVFVCGRTSFENNSNNLSQADDSCASEEKLWNLPNACIIPMPSAFLKDQDNTIVWALKEAIVGPPATPFYTRVNEQKDGGLDLDAIKIFTLSKFFDDPTTADFIIQIGDKTIFTHKAVLMNRSSWFKRLIAGGEKELLNMKLSEKGSDTIEVNTSMYHAYRAYLFYLYKGYVPDYLTPQETFELAELATLYLDDDLKNQAYSSALAKFMTNEYVFVLYALALKYKVSSIANRCAAFIFDNMPAALSAVSLGQFPTNAADAKDMLVLFQQALLSGALKG